MTLQQLKYIVAVSDYGHFGKAAEACGLTQSTLSLMIRKMEEELDVRIFDRDSHPVTPTEIGRKIIDQARVVLYNAGQLVEMTRSEKEAVSGHLRIALISTVAPVLVPGLFKYTGQHYPGIALQTEEMLSATIKDKLHRAEVDMGILTGPVNEPGLLEIPLYHEHFLAYVSPDHPDFSRDSISVEHLHEQPLWIIRDGLRQLDPSTLPPGERLSYERYFEGGRVGLLIQIVNENGGITVIPETHASLVMFSHQKCLRPIVDPQPSRSVSLVIRSDYTHEAKLNIVVEAIKTILPAALLDGVIRNGPLKL